MTHDELTQLLFHLGIVSILGGVMFILMGAGVVGPHGVM